MKEKWDLNSQKLGILLRNFADMIWEVGCDEVLLKAFDKNYKVSLFWCEQTIERKNV